MFTVKSFEFSPIQENTYILYNEFNECLIIDPGCYFQEEKEELKEYISSNKLKPKYLLNTHCHLDHVFGNKFVAETYGLNLHLHEEEVEVLKFAPASGLMYNMPFDNYTGEFVFLKEGDGVSLGSDRLEVVFLPGHSPASIGFWCKEQQFIVSGDVLFRGSIGRTDLPGGSFETLERSIKEKLYVLPDVTTVFSGHGPETSIGFEKANNPFVFI